MKSQSTFSAIFLLLLLLNRFSTSGQCPSSVGIVGTPVVQNGNCFLHVQFAIPNSSVSVFNSGGIVAQSTASSTGNVIIPYPCTSNTLISINSVSNSPATQVCYESTITPPLILPVKLISFDGELKREQVILNWKTAYELNNEWFEIEKSTDGINFVQIGKITCSGFSADEKNYQFEDNGFRQGSIAFYRLKQVDLDGKTSYSKVVYINDKRTAEFSVFPNPVQGNNSIMLKGVAATEVTYSNINISDITGTKIVYRITGSSTIELPASIVSGVYIIRAGEKIVKLIKE